VHVVCVREWADHDRASQRRSLLAIDSPGGMYDVAPAGPGDHPPGIVRAMSRVQIPSKLMAFVYDKLNAAPEKAGVCDLRRTLLARACGATLEVGAGTGLNLAHYPAAVTRLVITEPDGNMREKLQKKLDAGARPGAELTAAAAEDLPYEDASWDTVVVTMALCTVRDPAAALAELQRVLKPGGQLLALEHVRSERPRIARLQDAVVPLYGVIGRGCHPNRDTLAAIRAAGFQVAEHRRERAPKTPPTENELLVAVALRPA